MSAPSKLGIDRFGQVFDHHTFETGNHNGVVQPLTPGCESSSSTTWRDLSDNNRLTPSRVSPDEASLICQNVLSELAFDMATVRVASINHGCISGSLEWGQLPSQDVSFTLLRIQPGYTVVGAVRSGPELFKKVCWKLKSVNGCSTADPPFLCRGDAVVLEGPRWATQQLCLRFDKCKTSSAASAEARISDFATHDQSQNWSRTSMENSALISPALEASHSPLEFEVYTHGRSVRHAPVPKLDMRRVSPCVRSASPVGGLVSCHDKCQPAHGMCDMPLRCHVNMPECHSKLASENHAMGRPGVCWLGSCLPAL